MLKKKLNIPTHVTLCYLTHGINETHSKEKVIKVIKIYVYGKEKKKSEQGRTQKRKKKNTTRGINVRQIFVFCV